MSGEPASEEARYQALLALPGEAPQALEALVAGLHDESWRVRRAAAEGFGRLPERMPAVERLVAVLGERGETGARNAAAEALVGLGQDSVGPLLRLLGHADPDQRKFAADILGQLAQPEAEPALVQVLAADADVNVRVAAAEALGRLGGEAAVRVLEQVLHTPPLLLRLAALEALVALRRPPPLPELVPLLAEPRLRRGAYRALGLIPEVAATELACRGLASPVRSVREAALGALGEQARLAEPARRVELEECVREALLGLPQALAYVEQGLEAEEVAVRAGALVAAAALREAQLAPAVAEVAREPRLLPEVLRTLSRLGPEAGRALLVSVGYLSLPARVAAGQALMELVRPVDVPALVAMLGWGEPALQELALRALGRTRSPEAVGPLVERLGDELLAPVAARALVTLATSCLGPVCQALEEVLARGGAPAAVGALARVCGDHCLPLLRRTAREASPELRAAAVEAVAELEPQGGLELARSCLVDEAACVRAAAVRVLGRLAGPTAGTLLARALQDEEEPVRLAAVEALGECGAREHSAELAPWVAHPEGGVALRAVQALGLMGALTPELLRRAAAHADPEVVKSALQAGTTLPQGLALAVELLGHAAWDVRMAAARVLGEHGTPECLGAARRALEQEVDALARRALADAVEQLARR